MPRQARSPTADHRATGTTRGSHRCAITGIPTGALVARHAEQLNSVVQRERSQLDDGLTIDAERHLARAQDPQPWSRVEKADGEIGGGIDDVFAVVQDERRVGAAESFGEGGLATGHVQRRDHGVDDVGGRHRRLQPSQPHPTRRAQGAAGGDRHGRLADTADTDDLDQPPGGEQVGQGGDDAVSTDELDRDRRQVADGRGFLGRTGPRPHGGERSVVGEDLVLESLQLRSRVETELVGQQAPYSLICGQRVGLPSAPVQRRDQQQPEALLVRVGGHRRFQLADHIRGVAQLQSGREPRLEELRPDCFQPCPVRSDPVAITCPVENVTAVHLQGRRAQLGGAVVVADIEQLGCGGRVTHHGEGVDVVRVDGQHVAVAPADDHRRGAEGPPQLGDLRLERIAIGAEGVTRPQILDQTVAAHRGTGVESEPHQQLGRLPSWHRQQMAAAPDLDRSDTEIDNTARAYGEVIDGVRGR